MSRRFLFTFIVLAAPLFARIGEQDCRSSLEASNFFEDRLRQKLGNGFIHEQIENAFKELREQKKSFAEITQDELAQIWRDFVPLLEEYPAFKSKELKLGNDLVFSGRRSNRFYFLAITPEPHASLFYGVRTTALGLDSEWRKDNLVITAW